MITLYHGSNVAISKVGLSKGLKDKDFGQGFYLTDILSQAESMAQRRVRIVGTGIPTVTLFSFDESIYIYESWLRSFIKIIFVQFCELPTIIFLFDETKTKSLLYPRSLFNIIAI